MNILRHTAAERTKRRNQQPKRAKDFITKFFDEPERIQLEAFSLSDDKKSWNISYSFWRKTESSNQLQEVLGITGSKVYKTIEIDAEKGEVIGMKVGIAENAAETVWTNIY